MIVRENNTDAGLNDAIYTLLKLLGRSDVSVDVQRDRAKIMAQYITYIGSRSIAVKYPIEATFWDVDKNKGLTADMVSATSNVSYWWKCELNHSYKASPTNRLGTEHGCPYCSGRRVLKGFNDFETKYPDLVKEWDYERNGTLRPYDLSPGSTKQVFWMCEKRHSYKASPNNKVYNKTKCPYCSNIKVLSGFNDLKTMFPAIAAEWDYKRNGGKRPEDFSAQNNKKVWWICGKGHSYESTIGSRTAKRHQNGCPYCANKKVLKGYNDLQTHYPEIAKEWDYALNGDLSPSDVVFGSAKKVWWKCSKCDFSWQNGIVYRTSMGNGCPECNRRRLSKPVRCIETGECFQTIKEASQKTGIGKDSITKNLTGKNKSAGGYHWEYIKIDTNENN